MKPNANPLPKSGERNALCHYYEGCLDHAIERRWRLWSKIRILNITLSQKASGNWLHSSLPEPRVVLLSTLKSAGTPRLTRFLF